MHIYMCLLPLCCCTEENSSVVFASFTIVINAVDQYRVCHHKQSCCSFKESRVLSAGIL